MYRNKSDRVKIGRALGYQFKDERLLLQALTRRSGLNEGRQKSTIGDFQRLEFMGDKILNLVVSDILFENHPTWSEGQLTTEVSKFVNNKGPLAEMARHLNLGDYLIMGTGEEKINKGRENQKVLSDAFEALLGALWLDSGKDFNFMRNFLLKQFKALGLTDFNQDYEQLVIRTGMQAIMDDMLEGISLDCAVGNDRVMSVNEMLAQQKIKARATKPLTGVAAVFEHFLEADSGGENSEVEEAKTELVQTDDQQATPTESTLPSPIKAEGAKKSELPTVAALVTEGMGIGIAPTSANVPKTLSGKDEPDALATNYVFGHENH